MYKDTLCIDTPTPSQFRRKLRVLCSSVGSVMSSTAFKLTTQSQVQRRLLLHALDPRLSAPDGSRRTQKEPPSQVTKMIPIFFFGSFAMVCARNRRSGTVYRFPPRALLLPSPTPIAPVLRVTPYKLLTLSSSLQAPHFRASIPQAHVKPLSASPPQPPHSPRTAPRPLHYKAPHCIAPPSLQVEHHRHRVCQVALPQVRESCHGRPVDDTMVGGPTDLQELARHDVTLRATKKRGKGRRRERERE